MNLYNLHIEGDIKYLSSPEEKVFYKWSLELAELERKRWGNKPKWADAKLIASHTFEGTPDFVLPVDLDEYFGLMK